MSLWWLWDHNGVLTQTTVTMARSHDLLQPHSFSFSRSMFFDHDLIKATWPLRFYSETTNHHKAGRRRKTAAPHSALSSGALHRCCSTLDPHPAEDPTQHYCIFLVSRWPLTSWKAVFGNTLPTLHARLHRPAEGLFRFGLSTLFLCPWFNSVSQGSEVGGSWMADTKYLPWSGLGCELEVRRERSSVWICSFSSTNSSYDYISWIKMYLMVMYGTATNISPPS